MKTHFIISKDLKPSDEVNRRMEKADQLPQYKFLTTELSQIIESWIAHKRYDSQRSEHLGRKAQEYVENYSMRQFVETIKKHRGVKGNYKIQEARV